MEWQSWELDPNDLELSCKICKFFIDFKSWNQVAKFAFFIDLTTLDYAHGKTK